MHLGCITCGFKTDIGEPSACPWCDGQLVEIFVAHPRKDSDKAIETLIGRKINTVKFHMQQGWSQERALAQVKGESTMGPVFWNRVQVELRRVNP